MPSITDSFKQEQREKDSTQDPQLLKLKAIAEDVGVGKQAEGIIKKLSRGSFSLLTKAIDIAQRPQYAVQSGLKNLIDNDNQTTFLSGLSSGIQGETKTSFSDVLTTFGWTPKGKVGTIPKAIIGFAGDVLLDPITWVTFGTSRAGLTLLKETGKTMTLTEKGSKFVMDKVLKTGGDEGLRKLSERAIISLAQKDPQFAKSFIDQGGIKVFGQTLLSGEYMKEALVRVPYMKAIDRIVLPVREKLSSPMNTIGALFDKRIDTEFGKQGSMVIDVAEQVQRKLNIRDKDAIVKAQSLIKQTGINDVEAKIIAGARKYGTKIADPRLEQIKNRIGSQLDLMIKTEKQAGIKVRELVNYLPRILVKTSDTKKIQNIFPTKANIFSPVESGFSKARKIFEFTSETGETKIISLRGGSPLGLKNVGGAKFPATDLEFPFVDKYNIRWKRAEVDPTVQEINEAFGKNFFDENIVRAVTVRHLASNRAVARQELLRGVAKLGTNKGIPSNYVSSGVKELDELGYKFHPAIAKNVQKVDKAMLTDEATSKFFKAFDEIQNIWKASVTSIFPAFHGRNAISNVLQNFADIGIGAFSPTMNKLAGVLIKKNRDYDRLFDLAQGTGKTANKATADLAKLSAESVFTDQFGIKYTFGALRKLLRENDVAFSRNFTRADITESIPDLVKTATDIKRGGKVPILRRTLPVFSDFFGYEAGRSVGNAVEGHARILNFLTHLKQTNDPILSASRTRQVLFDYASLTPFEKTFMRRLLPFYTWSKKNLAQQVRIAKRTPGRITTQVKGMRSLGEVWTDGRISEEERKVLQKWVQDSLLIVTDRKGDEVTFLTGFDIPIESALTLDSKEVLNMLSPLIKVPVELITGRNFFKEQGIDEISDGRPFSSPAVPGFLKDAVGYRKIERVKKDGTPYDWHVVTKPYVSHIILSLPPTSRVFSTISQIGDDRYTVNEKAWRQVTGVKFSSRDIERDRQTAINNAKKELEQLLINAGAGGKKEIFFPFKK